MYYRCEYYGRPMLLAAGCSVEMLQIRQSPVTEVTSL